MRDDQITQHEINILIIDDDALVRQSVADYLSDSGYEVHVASDGRTGLALYDKIHPDLIICDLRMPEMDGLSVLRSLSARKVTTPLIFLSGAGSVSDVVEALRFGAADYLIKPIIDMEVLDHAVQRCLEQANLRLQNERYRMELEQANREMREYLRALETDQQAGRHVQLKILPKTPFSAGHYTFSHAILPSLYLSGDFVDYCTITRDQREYVVFFLGDVSGHGAASAFVTVMLKNLVARLRSEFGKGQSDLLLSPVDTLHHMNAELLETATGKHVTMVVGLLDLEKNALCYSVAGHLPLPVLSTGEDARYLEGKGMPVGLFNNPQYEQHTVDLPEQFSIYLYSDGILELLKAQSVPEKEQQLLKFSRMEGVGITADDVIERFKIAKIEDLPDDVALLRVTRQ
ncbi:MAG TPA: fused response regulator/phosphatase [Pseudomonadales bacterium]|nr:fused response regulator/phosphatase [Pseudomonadales bacterium]